MNLYLDTSALIKRYVNETGSSDVRDWMDRSADDKATALITRAEMSAAHQSLAAHEVSLAGGLWRCA